MKNEMTMYDVNKYVSEQTWIKYSILLNLFEESIKNMTLNQNLIDIALQLKQQWKNIAIVTNNMDCFTTITISHNKLNEIFPHIINSSDYGMLKQEEGWKLFDIAMDKVGCIEYKDTLLIDDSQTERDTFEKKWWHTFAYSDFKTFKQWADIHLL